MISETVVLKQFPFSSRREAVENRKTKGQRIYIMPTQHGAVFGLMLLAMLLGAVNYNNSMAYILTFLLGSLLHVAILHTCRNLAGLAISQAPVAPVFSGELARFPLILDNRKGHSRLSISFIKAPKFTWRIKSISSHAPITICSIDENKFSRIELPIKTEQRGLFYAGRIKIFTIFPLGLFKAWSYININKPCLVYPNPAGQDYFPPLKLINTVGIQGNVSGSDDFIGFRNYLPSDSIKDIAWKVYAQQKGLFIKQFSDHNTAKLHLSWDDISYLPDIEARLSQLCHWIIKAELQSLQYSLELPEVFIDTGHGEDHMHRCLSALSLYDTQIKAPN